MHIVGGQVAYWREGGNAQLEGGQSEIVANMCQEANRRANWVIVYQQCRPPYGVIKIL